MLFGSRARDAGRDDSDYDLALWATEPEATDLLEWRRELTEAVGSPVQLVLDLRPAATARARGGGATSRLTLLCESPSCCEPCCAISGASPSRRIDLVNRATW